jgi:hypothetical protein
MGAVASACRTAGPTIEPVDASGPMSRGAKCWRRGASLRPCCDAVALGGICEGRVLLSRDVIVRTRRGVRRRRRCRRRGVQQQRVHLPKPAHLADEQRGCN